MASARHRTTTMNMIRHDDPGLKLIGLAVLIAEDSFNTRGNFRPLEPALAMAAIQPRFELATPQRLIRFAQDGLPLPPTLDRKKNHPA